MSPATASSGRGPWRSRATLIGLFLLFAIPLGIATYVYRHPEVMGLGPQANHGDLVQPPQPIEALALTDVRSGEAFPLTRLEGKWTLVYVAGDRCSLACGASLYKMRQVRLSLGHESDRVQRLYMARAGGGLPDVLADYPDMARARLAGTQPQRMQRLFGDGAEGSVFVVDPHRNVMMRYGPDANAKGMLEDLKRLLEVSRIG